MFQGVIDGLLAYLLPITSKQQLAAGASVRDSAEQFTALMVKAFVVTALVLITLISLFIWRVQRSVCRPLWALRDLLQQVQQSSDLSLRANSLGSDEIAEAALALNQMISHFEQLVGRLGNSATALSEQAESVFQSSDDVSQGAGRQAEQADQLAAKIAKLRIFKDDEGRMNRSILDTGGSALVAIPRMTDTVAPTSPRPPCP